MTLKSFVPADDSASFPPNEQSLANHARSANAPNLAAELYSLQSQASIYMSLTVACYARRREPDFVQKKNMMECHSKECLDGQTTELVVRGLF